MKIDEIRKLGKKEIGYERHKTLLGEGSANSVLYHWMMGFKKALKIFEDGKLLEMMNEADKDALVDEEDFKNELKT